MLRERWPPWKAGLYDLEVVLPWECYFQTGRLAYDKWKRFIAEYDIWEREEDLGNVKIVVEFERRLNVEVRRQEKLDMAEERNFRREKLLGKYTVKMLYKWNDKKFEEKYLKKLERD